MHAAMTTTQGNLDQTQMLENECKEASNSLNDDFWVRPVVGQEDDDSEQNSDTEEDDCQLRQLDLKRSAFVESQKGSSLIPNGQSSSLNVTMRSSFSISVSLDVSDLLRSGSPTKCFCDFTNLKRK